MAKIKKICALCKKEYEVNKKNEGNDAFPLLMKNKYYDRQICNDCNEIVKKVRILSDEVVRPIQQNLKSND